MVEYFVSHVNIKTKNDAIRNSKDRCNMKKKKLIIENQRVCLGGMYQDGICSKVSFVVTFCRITDSSSFSVIICIS